MSILPAFKRIILRIHYTVPHFFCQQKPPSRRTAVLGYILFFFVNGEGVDIANNELCDQHRIKHIDFAIAIDGGTTNFSVYEGRIGLGYCFGKTK